MNILYWNLREAVSKTFFWHITDLINTHGPVIVVLLETKVKSDRAQIILPLDGFEGFAVVETRGFTDDIFCFWKVDVHLLFFESWRTSSSFGNQWSMCVRDNNEREHGSLAYYSYIRLSPCLISWRTLGIPKDSRFLDLFTLVGH